MHYLKTWTNFYCGSESFQNTCMLAVWIVLILYVICLHSLLHHKKLSCKFNKGSIKKVTLADHPGIFRKNLTKFVLISYFLQQSLKKLKFLASTEKSSKILARILQGLFTNFKGASKETPDELFAQVFLILNLFYGSPCKFSWWNSLQWGHLWKLEELHFFWILL